MRHFFFQAAISFLILSNGAQAIRIEPQWIKPLRSEHRFGLPPYERTQPILMGEILIAGEAQGRVVAIQRQLGFELWSFKMPGSVSGSLAYGRSKLVVGDRSGNLHVYQSYDRALLW